MLRIRWLCQPTNGGPIASLRSLANWIQKIPKWRNGWMSGSPRVIGEGLGRSLSRQTTRS